MMTQSDEIEGGSKVIRINFRRSEGGGIPHVNGVWGSVTSDSQIYMALFTQYLRMPDYVDYRVNRDDTLQQLEAPGSDEFVGEIQSEVVITLETAKGLVSWLQGRIKLIEDVTKRDATQQAKSD